MERYLGDRTAGEYRAHMTAIKEITDSWQNGEISVEQKRARIAAENARFYDSGQLGSTGQSLTSEPRLADHISYVISDSTGMPLEAVRAALHVRRVAHIKAANASSHEEAQALLAEGQRGYSEILETAR